MSTRLHVYRVFSVVAADAGDVQTGVSGKTLVGTGDPQSCLDILREHVLYKLDNDTWRCQRQQQCDSATSAVDQRPSPVNHGQFYAIGAFVYTLPSIGALADHSDVFVPATGYRKAFEFCHLVIISAK